MKKYLFLGLVIGLLMVNIAFADIPKIITVQGRLTDSNNYPVSKDCGFYFKLYKETTVLVWENSAPINAPVSNGVFNILLTDVNVNFDKPYELKIGVKCEGDSAIEWLLPKVKITSSGYAYTAAGAKGVNNFIVGSNLGLEDNVAGNYIGLYYTPPSGSSTLKIFGESAATLNVDLVDGSLTVNSLGGCSEATKKLYTDANGKILCGTDQSGSGGLACASCNGGTLQIPSTSGLELEFTGSNDANIKSSSYMWMYGGGVLRLGIDTVDGIRVNNKINSMNSNGEFSGNLYLQQKSGTGDVVIGDSAKAAGLTVYGNIISSGDITASGGRISLANSFISDDASSSYTRIDPQNNVLILYDGTSDQEFRVYDSTGGKIASLTYNGMTINGNTVWHAGNLNPNNYLQGTWAYDSCTSGAVPGTPVGPITLNQCLVNSVSVLCTSNKVVTGGCQCDTGYIKLNKPYATVSSGEVDAWGWECQCSSASNKQIFVLCG